MLILMSNSFLCFPDPQGWQGTCPVSSWALQQSVSWCLSNWVQPEEQLLPQHAENESQDKMAKLLLPYFLEIHHLGFDGSTWCLCPRLLFPPSCPAPVLGWEAVSLAVRLSLPCLSHGESPWILALHHSSHLSTWCSSLPLAQSLHSACPLSNPSIQREMVSDVLAAQYLLKNMRPSEVSIETKRKVTFFNWLFFCCFVLFI